MDKPYTFEDAGFDKFLTKKKQTTKVLDDEISLNNNQNFGGDTNFGISQSSDGKMIINWEAKQLTISDGARVRIIIGYIAEENKYGIRIIDSTGATQVDNTY